MVMLFTLDVVTQHPPSVTSSCVLSLASARPANLTARGIPTRSVHDTHTQIYMEREATAYIPSVLGYIHRTFRLRVLFILVLTVGHESMSSWIDGIHHLRVLFIHAVVREHLHLKNLCTTACSPPPPSTRFNRKKHMIMTTESREECWRNQEAKGRGGGGRGGKWEGLTGVPSKKQRESQARARSSEAVVEVSQSEGSVSKIFRQGLYPPAIFAVFFGQNARHHT